MKIEIIDVVYLIFAIVYLIEMYKEVKRIENERKREND